MNSPSEPSCHPALPYYPTLPPSCHHHHAPPQTCHQPAPPASPRSSRRCSGAKALELDRAWVADARDRRSSCWWRIRMSSSWLHQWFAHIIRWLAKNGSLAIEFAWDSLMRNICGPLISWRTNDDQHFIDHSNHHVPNGPARITDHVNKRFNWSVRSLVAKLYWVCPKWQQ